MRGPNNYFIGSARMTPRPCEACRKPVIVDRNNPEVYGAGRFCSGLCSRLRTPEAHWDYLMENPEAMEAYQEWQNEESKKGKHQLGQDRVLPI